MRAVTLVLAAVAAAGVAGAVCVPGAPPQYGAREFIEYVPGCGPIVLSAPHGGYEKPADVADRTYGATVQDSYTQEVTRMTADTLARLAGEGWRPHIVINRLHRIKLDANRDLLEAAQGDPQAEQAWYEYHAFIDAAKAAVLEQHGRGLYIDMHGHGHEEQWVELGYLLTGAELSTLSDREISEPDVVDEVSLRTRAEEVLATRGEPFSALLRGNSSLGGLLQRRYAAVPSPANPGPNGGNYFSGGYNTERHGSKNGGRIDGLQIEMPQSVRLVPVDEVQVFVDHLCQCLVEFWAAWWA